MARSPYPKRQSHFANKVVRLMLKTCAANDIGPEAVLLVTFIAHTEDAKHYREAVTYYNDQLMPVTGLATYNRLNRARQKAVDAGWLHYESGGKSRPGRYWATIPGEYGGIPDSPSDEGETEDCAPDCSSILEGQTGGKRESNGEVNGRKAEGQTGGKREPSLPIPNPSPVPIPKDTPVVPKDAADQVYEEYPLKAGKQAAIRAIRKALQSVEFDVLIGAVREYAAARRMPDGSVAEYTKHPATWFNQECWNDDRRTWKPKGTNGVTRVGPGVTHDPTAAERDPNYGKL